MSATGPTRYYDLLEEIDKVATGLKKSELQGAIDIMAIVSQFFYKLHFYDNKVLDQKAYVKTLEDIKEILLETAVNAEDNTK
jgi:hypothetical protein